MAFPRNSEGKLDIEAYVNLLAVSPEAAQLMENELVNEDQEVINYFYDNVERVVEEVREKNNAINYEKLQTLNAKYHELELQKQQPMLLFQANMLKTLESVKKDDGTPLTMAEKIALNDQLVEMERKLIEEGMERLNITPEPVKTTAQLKKEEEKRLVAAMRAKVEISDRMHAENPQPTQSASHSTTNHRTSKNRGCTLF